MKTVQAVARYFPEKCGGIQIRLSELLPMLQDVHGIESKIAAAQDSPHENTYTYRGTEVYRYPVFPTPKAEPNHGEFPHGGFEQFAHWLKLQKADLYHQHQWTPKCGLSHLRLAKELGLATLVSIRVPQPICQRETLMFEGREACDGKIDKVRCSYCCGVSTSLPASAIESLSQTPIPASSVAQSLLRGLNKLPAPLGTTSGALLRPVSIPAFVAARQRSLLEMARLADRIVTLSELLGEMLVLNGVPREKLTICRTGISDSFPKGTTKSKKEKNDPLRVVFLGRWNRTKGIHLLVEAVKSLPDTLPIKLTIYGSAVDDERYRQEILERIVNEPRILVAQSLSREALPSILATYDVLALPAQWFDVRPGVILEAQALGLPVLGSNMGGIPELIRHEVDGLLLPPTDVKAWSQALTQLAVDANLLPRLREGIQPVRTLRMEAEDTAAVYQSVLDQQGCN
ncbi:glycosyltransferase [Pleurocapsales cyanobacterium LEGE 10410]|nr:glycosyltransferase [Pleurocapsales cyanobacterium LEGE 10410]